MYLSSQFAIEAHLEPKLAVTRKLATRHNLVAVVANFAGTTAGLMSAGRSTILSERGECVAQLAPIGAGIALARREGESWQGQSLPLC